MQIDAPKNGYKGWNVSENIHNVNDAKKITQRKKDNGESEVLPTVPKGLGKATNISNNQLACY